MRNVLQKVNEIREARYVMGTVVEIIANVTENHQQVSDVVRQALEEFERLERIFSRFDPDSELSRLNQLADQQPVPVSEEFFEIVSQGLFYSSCSGGAFSITLTPVLSLWETCELENRFPGQEELKTAFELTRTDLILLDKTLRTVRFGKSGVALDFGGFVKGYAVDRAREILHSGGIHSALINAGTSSIAACGSLTSEEGWRIGIRHPGDEHRVVLILSLTDQTISTSGTYERRFIIGDQTASHLIDPRTGEPLEGVISATAVGESAAQAEVVSKILACLGLEQGIELCENNGWSVEGCTISGAEVDENMNLMCTEGFPIY